MQTSNALSVSFDFQEGMPIFLIWAYHDTSDVQPSQFSKHSSKGSQQVTLIPAATPTPTPTSTPGGCNVACFLYGLWYQAFGVNWFRWRHRELGKVSYNHLVAELWSSSITMTLKYGGCHAFYATFYDTLSLATFSCTDYVFKGTGLVGHNDHTVR